ncbi:DLA class I histocompatibility antigen, A9/A9 alpha chain-like [Ochotona curzoniae]|uniref:DLA class I histocompatibility antigen, A9/A9 alpha chain-like n=1 Tax=Ochotona curzoniae TaxID=130825 RepID=UPI001B34D16B|nr:DLA class I histocompatibility antigen, A9/A9 alpha chain-like [Ochotona curzoniae]XP_040853211.1 DLA class I histocompatibility antigen, A9/A9 alpha chain-like [Ochotona curzoniae]
MFGCEVRADRHLLRIYSQHSYNGTDCFTLNENTLTWTMVDTMTHISRPKWDAQQCTFYLNNECVEWLRRFLEMGKEELQRTDPPTAQLSYHQVSDQKVTLR